MSASVLFDSPGPRTRARHRGYTVLTVLVIVAILAYAAIRLGQHGQFEYSKWEPFVTPKYIEAIVFKGILVRSEEHTSELQSLMRISYAVFCLKKKNTQLHEKHIYKKSYKLTQTHKRDD